MNFVALVSGGKDSIFTICKLIEEGNKLVALVHILSKDEYVDSYMYQTVGSEVAELLGDCFDIPIYCFKSDCKPIDVGLEYSEQEGDEVEDMYKAISYVMKRHQIDAVSSGAIESRYQKNRVENVCKRLNIHSLTPLWKKDQRELLQEMIDYGIDARIVKIASSSLGKECLNMNLKEIRDYMDGKNSKYGMNYCGEGGEYETLVLDCKHFKKRIICGSTAIFGHPDEKNREDGVYYMKMENLTVQPK